MYIECSYVWMCIWMYIENMLCMKLENHSYDVGITNERVYADDVVY